ncbi:Homeobox domain [Dillenia turbinata]|uniref:Histidine-containing phosphotransfer protein n=1 Tax=Dillenia turbinata TaxID=194707 RepID=A0AAN8W972_9MAGN
MDLIEYRTKLVESLYRETAVILMRNHGISLYVGVVKLCLFTAFKSWVSFRPENSLEILDYQFGQVMAFQDENDPNFVVDVTSIFCEDAQRTIHELSLLLNQPVVDFGAMEARLQKLRGGSLSIGAHRVNLATVEFLLAAQASNREGCLHALNKLMIEYQIVHAKFEIIVQIEQKIKQYEMQKMEIAHDKYPAHEAMEDYALELQLTYKQVRGWFVERRRKDKREGLVLARRANLPKLHGDGGESSCLDSACNSPGRSPPNAQMPATLRATDQRKKKQILLQNPLTPDYILKKIFQKDGPPLGIDFDSLPSKGFSNSSGSECAPKRIRVIETDCMGPLRGVDPAVAVPNETCVPMKKHSMGKRLMTVWRATNPNGGDFPTGLRFAGREQTIQERKLRQRRPVIVCQLLCDSYKLLTWLFFNIKYVINFLQVG